MSTSLYDIPVHRIDGTPATLAEYKHQVMMIVNVASKCGLTKQYDGLEKLYEQYRDRGLVVAGFPANDFAQQEPGSNGEIQDFCRTNFGVQFPLFEKITVVGEGKHPLYRALTEAQPTAESTSDVPFHQQLKNHGMTPNSQPEILWNFEKFLVSKRGEVVRRFAPDTRPDDPVLLSAVEALLAEA
jgi:glutathione peroxidase